MGQETDRPRGRPRGFAVEDALDRAIDVFWTLGYAGAPMSALTRAMKLSPPSVYAAFGDKRGLFLAVLDRYAATTGGAPAQALGGDAPLGTRIERFLAAAVELAFAEGKGRGCLAACVAGDAAAADDEIRRRLDAQMRAAEAALEAAAGTGGPSGRLLLAAIQAVAVRARAGASRAEVEALAGELAVTLEAAARPAAGEPTG